MLGVHPREEDDNESDTSHGSKKARLDDESGVSQDVAMEESPALPETVQGEDTDASKREESILPPSHALLGIPTPTYSAADGVLRIMESDVGISEYVGHDVPKIEGIIKQRSVHSFLLSHNTSCLSDSQISSFTRWTLMAMSYT